MPKYAKTVTIDELKKSIEKTLEHLSVPIVDEATNEQLSLEERLSHFINNKEQWFEQMPQETARYVGKLTEDLSDYENSYDISFGDAVFLKPEQISSYTVSYEDFPYMTLSLLGFHTLDNGLSFYGGVMNVEDSYPVFVLIYKDRNDDLRLYLPDKGNGMNPINQLPFGIMPESDDEFSVKQGFESFDDLSERKPSFILELYDSEEMKQHVLDTLYVNETFSLVEPKGDKANTFVVKMIADSNDADYVHSKAVYSQEKFNKEVLPALNHLYNFGTGDGKLKDYEDLYNVLHIPSGEWETAHTLSELHVQYVDENLKIWDVELNYSKLPPSAEEDNSFDERDWEW